MNPKPHNPTLQVRVPRWMRAAVQELADTQEVSTSEILRQALSKYLEQRDITPPGIKTDH